MAKFTLKLAADSTRPTNQEESLKSSPMGVSPAAIRAIEKLTGVRLTGTRVRPEDVSPTQRPK